MHAARWNHLALMLAATALFGASNIFLKIAYTGIGPLWCGTLRFVIAAVVLLAVFGRTALPALAKAGVRAWLPSALCMTGTFVSAALSVNFTTATTAGFFFALPMLFTPAFALFASGKRFGVGTVVLQAVVLAGLYLLCCDGGSLSFGLGEFFGLACSAFYAAGLVFCERCLDEVGSMPLALAQMGVSAIAFFGFALVLEPLPELATVSPGAWGSVFALGVGIALAFCFQNSALEHTPPAVVSVVVCMEPVFTMLLSFAVLGEHLTAIGLAGAAIIVACTLVASAADVDALFLRVLRSLAPKTP